MAYDLPRTLPGCFLVSSWCICSRAFTLSPILGLSENFLVRKFIRILHRNHVWLTCLPGVPTGPPPRGSLLGPRGEGDERSSLHIHRPRKPCLGLGSAQAELPRLRLAAA